MGPVSCQKSLLTKWWPSCGVQIACCDTVSVNWPCHMKALFWDWDGKKSFKNQSPSTSLLWLAVGFALLKPDQGLRTQGQWHYLFKLWQSTLSYHKPSTFFMGHTGLLWREYFDTSSPTANLSLIKMIFSFCSPGIGHCFKLATCVGLNISTGSHWVRPMNTDWKWTYNTSVTILEYYDTE